MIDRILDLCQLICPETMEKMGIRQDLEKLREVIRAETCMIISPVKDWGFRTMMTDSGKCSYYGPAECGTEMIFASVGRMCRISRIRAS